MKKLVAIAFALLAAVTSASHAHAQAPVLTAGEIATSCLSAKNIKLPNGEIDTTKPQDILKVGQCVGFLKGWIEGADGTTYMESNGAYVRITIKRDHIKDMGQIADELLQYLAKTSGAAEKAADDVLRKVLHEQGQLSLTMVPLQPKP